MFPVSGDMFSSSWVCSQKTSHLLPSTMLASLNLQLPPRPTYEPPSPPNPPKPPDPPDPPQWRSSSDAFVTIALVLSPSHHQPPHLIKLSSVLLENSTSVYSRRSVTVPDLGHLHVKGMKRLFLYWAWPIKLSSWSFFNGCSLSLLSFVGFCGSWPRWRLLLIVIYVKSYIGLKCRLSLRLVPPPLLCKTSPTESLWVANLPDTVSCSPLDEFCSHLPTAYLLSCHSGSLAVIFYLDLTVNSRDWLGLVQPFVSSSDTDVAFSCAPTAIGSSWAGFVRSHKCASYQAGSLFEGQPWTLCNLLSVYTMSKGVFSMTISSTFSTDLSSSTWLVPFGIGEFSLVTPGVFPMVVWYLSSGGYRLCPGHDLNLISTRSLVLDSSWTSQGLFPVTPLSVIQRSTNSFWLVPMYLSSRLHHFHVPQYEDDRLIIFDQSLTTREIIISSFGVIWLVSGYLLDRFIKDPIESRIHQESSSRPYVLCALVAEELALKVANIATLALGVSRLASYSDWHELITHLNFDGHAHEDVGFSVMKTNLRSIHFQLVTNFVISCIASSLYGV